MSTLDVPAGSGSADLCHTSTALIDEGAAWLASTPRSQRGPAALELRKRFGLTVPEAYAAIRAATLAWARAM